MSTYQKLNTKCPNDIIWTLGKIYRIRGILQKIFAICGIILGVLSIVRLFTWPTLYYPEYASYYNTYFGIEWYRICYTIFLSLISLLAVGIFVLKILTLVQIAKLKKEIDDERLKQSFLTMLIGIICEGLGLWLISYILYIISYHKFSNWFESITLNRNTKGNYDIVKGTKRIRLGEILKIFLFIGQFVQSSGSLKFYHGVRREGDETGLLWINEPQSSNVPNSDSTTIPHLEKELQQTGVVSPPKYKETIANIPKHHIERNSESNSPLKKMGQSLQIRGFIQFGKSGVDLIIKIAHLINIILFSITYNNIVNSYYYGFYYMYDFYDWVLRFFLNDAWYLIVLLILLFFAAIFELAILIFKILFIVQVKNYNDYSYDSRFQSIYSLSIAEAILHVLGLGAIGYILNIMIYSKLADWAEELYLAQRTKNTKKILKGSKVSKIGQTLRFFKVIGPIVQSIGFIQLNNGLKKEFGGSSPSKTQYQRSPTEIRQVNQTQEVFSVHCPRCKFKIELGGSSIPNIQAAKASNNSYQEGEKTEAFTIHCPQCGQKIDLDL